MLLTTCVSLLPFCQAQQILSVMHFSQDLLLDLGFLSENTGYSSSSPSMGSTHSSSTFRDDSGADFSDKEFLNRWDREACCLLETARRGWASVREVTEMSEGRICAFKNFTVVLWSHQSHKQRASGAKERKTPTQG